MTIEQERKIQNKLAKIANKYKRGEALTQQEIGALTKLVYGAKYEDFKDLLGGAND